MARCSDLYFWNKAPSFAFAALNLWVCCISFALLSGDFATIAGTCRILASFRANVAGNAEPQVSDMTQQLTTRTIADIRRGTFHMQDLDFIDPTTVAEPDFAYRIASNEYGHYCIPEEFAEGEVAKLLLKGGTYEAKTLALMRRIVGHGDIVTGGAFVGTFFAALSHALKPHAALHSFEPNQTSFCAALKTIALNGLRNVTLSPSAVGATEGTLFLRTRQENGNAVAAASHIVDAGTDEGIVQVAAAPLDSLIPADRDVSVLHLDLCGYEHPALKGARELITRCRPTLVLDAARPNIRRQHLALLNAQFPDLNYVMGGQIEQNTVYLSQP